MLRSAGLRFLIVGFLGLIMFIPLELVSAIVSERDDYSLQTIREVSREWGGAQLISGPQLVIPVQELVTEERRRTKFDQATGEALRDDKGELVYEIFQEDVLKTRDPIYVYP
ncbi:Inner membrane protein CreD-like protein [Candidatus Rhodobacter oscarellae]|uniref:Inner membrane protein CreD-like protein n=1 Tax=Candidatus Rhodobacter oscarellae TaxID=1675527 RepID=A0A0J9E9Z0_9RHOB|nr:Inner membrane protein CreD-like protein [Candidatus Rhodobacter lobularis]